MFPAVKLALSGTILFAAVMASSLPLPALAADPGAAWPSRPLRLLVGFPAGGPTDVVARIVGERIAQQTGQRVVVDNRPGAAGNIAAEILARATPDGHTLLARLEADAEKEFADQDDRREDTDG